MKKLTTFLPIFIGIFLSTLAAEPHYLLSIHYTTKSSCCIVSSTSQTITKSSPQYLKDIGLDSYHNIKVYHNPNNNKKCTNKLVEGVSEAVFGSNSFLGTIVYLPPLFAIKTAEDVANLQRYVQDICRYLTPDELPHGISQKNMKPNFALLVKPNQRRQSVANYIKAIKNKNIKNSEKSINSLQKAADYFEKCNQSSKLSIKNNNWQGNDANIAKGMYENNGLLEQANNRYNYYMGISLGFLTLALVYVFFTNTKLKNMYYLV